jgi:cyclopropane fatty-acyl-phospholipid synthase-like methyltransferase
MFSAGLRRFDAQEAPPASRETGGQGHNQVDFSAAALYFSRTYDCAYWARDHRHIGSFQINKPVTIFTKTAGKIIDKTL